MNFCSDNVSGVSPEILSALTTANNGSAMPYGADEVTARVVAGLRALFDAPAAEIVLMSTGSSANALALATMTPPFAAVYCHPESHVNVDECGAPEFYTGGAKLVPVEGQHAKMSVEAWIGDYGGGVVHHVQPAAVSVTQVTEAGTLYTLKELRAISDSCKRHGLKLHMDGARFANAIEALGCTPAACSHELGVDALSFGATKNGAMCAEAILFFDPDWPGKPGIGGNGRGICSPRCGFYQHSSMPISPMTCGGEMPGMQTLWRRASRRAWKRYPTSNLPRRWKRTSFSCASRWR